jgi:hypothetical protein
MENLARFGGVARLLVWPGYWWNTLVFKSMRARRARFERGSKLTGLVP